MRKRMLGIVVATAAGAALAPAAASAGSVTYSASSFDFGSVKAGTVSAPQALTVTVTQDTFRFNAGTKNLGECCFEAENVSCGSAFDNPSPVPLSCTINLRFAPVGSGLRTGKMDLGFGGDVDLPIVTVTGTGIGSPPKAKPKKCKKAKKGAAAAAKGCKKKKK